MSEPLPIRPNRVRQWLLLNLLLLTLVGLLSLTYPVEELSRRLGDFYFRLRGTQPVSPHVALVLIDDASLARYGRWPWPRSLIARLVSAASAQRPAVLGLDILLSEPEDGKNDGDLAEALKRAGNVVLAAKIGGSLAGSLWVDPLPIFARSAAGVGHAQAALGPDGICRSIPISEMSTDGPRWAFALEVARVARGLTLREEANGLWLGGTQVAVEGPVRHADLVGVEMVSPRFLTIDYRGQLSEQPSSPFMAVSASRLLEGSGGEQLRGKTVLIGFAATTGMSDRLPTPVSDRSPMSGVEIHANVVDALLSGRGLQPLGASIEMLLLLGGSLLSTWVVLHWPGREGLLALAALLFGSYAGGYLLFSRAHRLIEFGPLLCLGLLAGPLAQLENLVVVDRGLARGLRQLQRALRATPPEMGGLRAAVHAEIPAPAGDLHWKLELLSRLQAELGSLYAFDETLLDAMKEGLAVFAPDGRLLFRNPRWQRFCELQGWNPAGSLDEFITMLGEPGWRELSARVSQPGAHLESEVQLGGGLWQIRGVRLPPTSHAGTGALMVAVADLTAQLERDRAREEALGFVTHELRTPLVSIQGFAEFLLRYSEGSKAEKEAATTIFRESKRLVAMINTYLDVLRLEAGSRALQRELVDIEVVVSQVEGVVRTLAQAADISVRVEIDEGLPPLRGDAHLIGGALLNLVSNAVKYSPAGSDVRLHVLAEESSVVFEVSNLGPPIPPRDLERLFEPFYRGRAQEDSTPGWGLGLAFVKRIVEGHGGRVEASSDAAAGTQFRILFPAAPALTCEAPS